jgi:hypothetical protein
VLRAPGTRECGTGFEADRAARLKRRDVASNCLDSTLILQSISDPEVER